MIAAASGWRILPKFEIEGENKVVFHVLEEPGEPDLDQVHGREKPLQPRAEEVGEEAWS